MPTPPTPGETTEPITAPFAVLVVDDQPAVRDGLARLVACGDFALREVRTAATRTEALVFAAVMRPEVVLLDADLAGEDGLALIPHLAPAAVLVITCHGDPATRERAARLGARAFLEKHQPAALVLEAVGRLATLGLRGEVPPPRPVAGSHPGAVASSDSQAPLRS